MNVDKYDHNTGELNFILEEENLLFFSLQFEYYSLIRINILWSLFEDIPWNNSSKNVEINVSLVWIHIFP